MRKDCGWKCETEGEAGSEERENGKQAEKYLAFYLPLIKPITLSLKEIESGIDGDTMERERKPEVINRLMKLLLEERWIDRDDTDEE